MVNRTYAILTIGCSVIEENPQKTQTFLWHNLTNQNQNQRYEVRVGFTGYECRVAFQINSIKPIKALPGYEVRMDFPVCYERAICVCPKLT